jgi:hypothetical protein
MRKRREEKQKNDIEDDNAGHPNDTSARGSTGKQGSGATNQRR